MSKKAAFLTAGVISALVIVLALGVAGSAHWFNQTASAASSQPTTTTTTGAVCTDPAEVANLQGQLADYQAALQQANNQLQAAYNEIATLQAQGRFPGEHERNENEGGFFGSFGGD